MSASPRHPKAPPIPPHSGVEVLEDRVAYGGRFAMQIVRFHYTRFDGQPSSVLTWELWRRGQGVAMLPWDPVTDRIALIEQFRLPALAAGLPAIMTECPAGLLEPTEEPERAARRETREETGLEPIRMARVGEFMLMQGGCDEVMHYYIAQVSLSEGAAPRTHGLAHEGEDTRVLVMPAEEAFRMVAEGRIANVTAATLILWLQVNRERLRREWTAA